MGILIRIATFGMLVMGLTLLAAQDKTTFNELAFADNEFTDLSDTLEDSRQTLGDIGARNNPTYNVDPAQNPDFLTDPIGFFASIGQAIWNFIQTVVTFVVAAAQTAIVFGQLVLAVMLFDVPALRAHPALQLIRFAIIVPMWIGIPYLFIRVIRGGG